MLEWVAISFSRGSSQPRDQTQVSCSAEASLVAHTVKNLPAMQETRVQALGQEDSLEKEMAIHSRILVSIFPWKEEPGGLQCMESQRVGHD